MYGDVVMGVEKNLFEHAIHMKKEDRKVKLDTDLTADDLASLVDEFKGIVRDKCGREFPQDPQEQLWGAVDAVFGSWMNERAITYRRLEKITGLKGTAVNVQSMVFGNFGDDSGTGVCFSRDPSTGENYFYGEYLMNAQGEDVVAGIRTPEKLSTLEKQNPEIYKELVGLKEKLEKHFRDMQDMEFTVERGKLYILQARNGKRAGAAAVKVALDMVKEGFIDKETAINRVTPGHIDQLLHPMIDPVAKKSASSLTKGLSASPGAASGKIVFTAKDAEEWHRRGDKVLLVRKETSPEDIGGMIVSEGILTSTGGMTSHAAVVARGMGTPCVAGAGEVTFITGNRIDIKGRSFGEGDVLTIDGSTGNVYEGSLPLVEPSITKDMETFLGWCDDVRNKAVRGKMKGLGIRTNADTPKDAKRAFDFGAEGIGLCRTEHMFFEEKLPYFRAMIVADTKEERRARLKELLPLQQKDFHGIFKAMEGRPVTIRLLDPPLHEFVPHTDTEIRELAQNMGIDAEKLRTKVASLKEANPMLGHRGCRLAVTYPEIYDMQVEAIARAALECVKEGVKVQPEIMIPLVFGDRELNLLLPCAEKILADVFAEAKVSVPVKVGTMIEIPRAAVRAGEIAVKADFFSFGTNDLTQMTFGISRDDIGTFLPDYLEKGVFDVDPFEGIDEAGVGALMRMAIEQGREVKPGLSIGICGEHGGDPATIDFCYRAGLSYISCSPFRVPIARLAGAQAVIRNSGKTESSAAKKPARAASAKTAKATGRKAADAKKATAGRKPAAKAAVKKTALKTTEIKKKTAVKMTADKKATAKKPVKGAVGKPKAGAKKASEAKKAAPGKKPAVAKKPTAAKKPVAAKKPAKKTPKSKS
jgi:pyruvate,orthophosphate dikinase